MAARDRDWIAEREAECLVREFGAESLPIDPVAIAEWLGITVEAMPATGGVSGMLIRVGDRFAIGYATRIENEGFRRFSVAHEIGHYRLPGHIDAVLSESDRHASRAGRFGTGDPYERQADRFAAALLMPEPLFSRELRRCGDGLEAVERMAGLCATSLTATAIRYVGTTDLPTALVVSDGSRVKYCFMSKALREFDGLAWPRKGESLPEDSETELLDRDPANIRSAKRAAGDTDLRAWFGGPRRIPGVEEVVGLGRSGETLTILSAETFADDEEEEEELEERWTPRFRR